MVADIIKLNIITAEYSGPDRRYCNERRVALDRRNLIRFDVNGGDRRSGFSRRHFDEGLRERDYF
jgi:hypothetical protein